MSLSWDEKRALRWMQPNAQRWLRHDAHRFMPPGQSAERKFNPEQPRVPAGNSEGGQWSNGDFAISPRNLTRAGGLPTIPPKPPPTTKARNAIIKAVAYALYESGSSLVSAVAKTSWLYHAAPYINAYLDTPKTLDQLQDAVSNPQTGYDIHHIVEQTSAERDGYPRRRIDAPDNLALVPTLRHWRINAWYQRKNDLFGGMSPRDYLRGKDWDERRRVGLQAMADHGVLKP